VLAAYSSSAKIMPQKTPRSVLKDLALGTPLACRVSNQDKISVAVLMAMINSYRKTHFDLHGIKTPQLINKNLV